MVEGMEHHFILAPGHNAAALSEFAEWTNMERIGLVPYRDHLQSRS